MKFNILFAFFIPALLFAQYNLKLEQNTVVWQKVYDFQTSPEQYKKQLLRSLNFENIDMSDDIIYVVVRNLQMDYKTLGKSELTTSMYLARTYYDAIAVIEFKENRFRVTVKDLKSIQIYSDGLNEKGEMYPLEFWAINKKGGFKRRFINNDAEIIDFTLDKLFYPHKIKNDDW